MKDSYPLTLFGYESFINSKDNSNINFYICPFFLFIEVLGNSEISNQIRKKYLNTTFIFIVYYLHQLGFIRTITTRISIIRFLNTILGIYYCLKRDETNLFHLGTYPIECFYGYVRVDCHFNHTLFNILHSMSKSVLTSYFMNELGLKRKKIRGRKSIGGVIAYSTQQKGYFPFDPNEFFIFYLRKLYNLSIDESIVEKFNSWIQYLIDNQSEIRDVYNQGKLAGCNIFCRNIAASENKSPDSLKKNFSLLKSYLKKPDFLEYVNELRDDISKLLNETIKECDNNSLLILNKVFGFIINKKEYTPKESDKNKFIVNLIRQYNAMKSLEKRKQKRKWGKFLACDARHPDSQTSLNSSFQESNGNTMLPNQQNNFWLSPPHLSESNKLSTMFSINAQSTCFTSNSMIKEQKQNQ